MFDAFCSLCLVSAAVSFTVLALSLDEEREAVGEARARLRRAAHA